VLASIRLSRAANLKTRAGLLLKYLPLVWAGFWRKKARTVLTILSITVAFLLFGILQGVNAGFAHIAELRRLDRLFTVSRFGVPLPISYRAQIASVPGVTLVAPSYQMGAYWRDPKNGLGLEAVDAAGWFDAFPETSLTRRQLDTFVALRTGALVSVACAQQFGWKPGDKISLVATTPQRNGSKVWTLDVVAVLTAEGHESERFVIANYSYFDEARADNRGTADAFVDRISDPAQAGRISETIDKLFATSGAQTRTVTERANNQSNQSVTFNVKFFIETVVSASLFTLLFLTANTMMQSVRERTPELAVLKTVGFSGFSVLALVIGESALMTLAGAGLGLFIADLLMPLAKKSVGIASVRPVVFLDGAIAALIIAIVSAMVPALRASRLSIVDAISGR
jgi:putative ABC transport system permease protein